MIEPTGGMAYLIKVLAVTACGCPLLSPFRDDVQLLTAEQARSNGTADWAPLTPP